MSDDKDAPQSLTRMERTSLSMDNWFATRRIYGAGSEILAGRYEATLQQAEARIAELTRDTDKLNRMLRETGQGQGAIDAYAAQCEDIDALRAREAKMIAAVRALQGIILGFSARPGYAGQWGVFYLDRHRQWQPLETSLSETEARQREHEFTAAFKLASPASQHNI